MKNSNSGISSFGKGLPKITQSLGIYQKTKVVKSILEFLSSKGLTAEGTSQTSGRGSKRFSDVLTSIAGKPVEVLVGVKKLSKPQINFGRTISNSGGLFVSVTNAEDFRAWYYRAATTIKPSRS